MAAFEAWHVAQKGQQADIYKLCLLHTHGSILIKAKYGPTTYTFDVIPLQAAVLLLFSDEGSPPLTAAEISKRLQLTDSAGSPLSSERAGLICRSILHSLSCLKVKVLKKTPSSPKVMDSDSFEYNADFSDPKRSLSIPFSMSSLDEDNDREKKSNDEGRVVVIEAAAVRILKARHTLTHTQLVTAVLEQELFFQPAPRLIKKAIENLIERSFIERLGADEYSYIA